MVEVDSGERTGFAITLCGEPAAQTLQARAIGCVAAVFDHSFYVAMDDRLACIGTAAISHGPLNARSTAPAATLWPSSGICVRDRVSASPRGIHVGTRFTFNVGAAKPWMPPPPPHWTPATLRSGLAALEHFARRRVTPDGLALYVLPDPTANSPSPTFERARVPIRRLAGGIGRAMESGVPLPPETARWVSALVGLGPGLTPSGDDFLGGMMIALFAVNQPAVLPELSSLVQQAAKRRTNLISRAHLAAAGNGAGAAALHAVLNDVLAGRTRDMAFRLDDVARIGHGSGWDALAGAATVLRACDSAPAGY
jgi:hypothetical protein